MKIRLAKKISDSRLYSRRDAEKLIFEGLVKVNKITINTPVFFVDDNDIIEIDGNVISKSTEPKLWLFYKPKGIITSKEDKKGRTTVFDILPPDIPKVIYAGRLDYNSEGLLLLTNNGSLGKYLTNPINKIKRIYKVKTFGKVSQSNFNTLKNGIIINGIKYSSMEVNIINTNGLQSWLEFTLTEGKKNEIRNICTHFNLKVSRLIRTQFGPFSLGNLKPKETKLIPYSIIKQKLPNFYE